MVYGLVGLKTHSKIMLVVRREGDRIRRYVHLGTGNYNPATARIYTDLGLLTCDDDLGADATELFNQLTGYSPDRLPQAARRARRPCARHRSSASTARSRMRSVGKRRT